jgi:hypothetical protein
MNNHLNVTQDIKLKYLDKDYRHYLNKSTLLFGASGSGKSTIILEILYLLRDHVPNIFIFSPTAEANNAFEGIVPDQCVFKTVDIPVLEKIYKRQQAATKLYNKVNNLHGLRLLFEKIADYKSVESAKLAYNNANSIIQSKENGTGDHLERKSAIREVKKLRDEYLVTLYKKVIRDNRTRLANMRLTELQKYIVKYLDFNPNCIVLFDDCGAILKKFQNEIVVKKILFQGRHDKINLILSLQDDSRLDAGIKKNAFVNIFTTARSALGYFEKKNNNFSKKEKMNAEKILNYLFSSNGKKKDFKKFVYLRDDPDPCRYMIADIYDNWRFGCPSLWDICNRLDEGANSFDFDEDPLMSAFTIDL